MIDDPVLGWVVTALFLASAAQWAFAIATQRRVWTAIVRYGLHFVMSVAMAMMAWPWGPKLPTLESAVFFLLAAGWFVIATAFLSERTVAKRAEYGYHALMIAGDGVDVRHHGRAPVARPIGRTHGDDAGHGYADTRRASGMDHDSQLVLVRRLSGGEHLLGLPIRC